MLSEEGCLIEQIVQSHKLKYCNFFVIKGKKYKICHRQDTEPNPKGFNCPCCCSALAPSILLQHPRSRVWQCWGQASQCSDSAWLVQLVGTPAVPANSKASCSSEGREGSGSQKSSDCSRLRFLISRMSQVAWNGPPQFCSHSKQAQSWGGPLVQNKCSFIPGRPQQWPLQLLDAAVAILAPQLDHWG